MADVLTSEQARSGYDLPALARGIGGAVLGAVAGFAAFTLLVKFFGVYAIAVPGLLVGLVAASFSQRRSLVLGVVCLALAAVTIVLTEWWNFPFLKDGSLGFFLQHLTELQRLFWLSLLLGGGLAFWLGTGSDRTSPRTPP